MAMEFCRLSSSRQQLQGQLKGLEVFLGLQQQQRGDHLLARFKLDPGESAFTRAALMGGGLQLPSMGPATLLIHEESATGPQKFGAGIQRFQGIAFGRWVP